MSRAVDERFTVFVRQHTDGLLRLAYLLTQDHQHAEDVVQIALLRTHRRWTRLGEPEHALAYTRRVVANTAAGRRRVRSNRELVDLPDHHVDAGPPACDGVAEQDLMRQALRGLPPRMRAVLVLRYFEDLSEAATADVLGCTVHTVRAHAARGLARLRAALPTLTDDQPTTRRP